MYWISVIDELPELEQQVLTLRFYDVATPERWRLNIEHYEIAIFYKLATNKEPFYKPSFKSVSTNEFIRVVHFWMPLVSRNITDKYKEFYISNEEIYRTRNEVEKY